MAENQPTSIGWLGLGVMGFAQAMNIVKKYAALKELVVYDVDPSKAQTFKDQGGSKVTVVGSPKEVVEKVEVVFTMLPTPQVSLDVYSGVLDVVKKGQVFVECSTAGSKVVAELSKMLESKGAVLVDAPVSGGAQGAEAATLTFIVGTQDSPSLEERSKLPLDKLLAFTTPQLEYVRPLLLAMGKNVFHCGPIGAGQVAKLGNNNLIYIHILALSYSLLSGAAHGVPPALLSSIINVSTGRSFMSTHWNPDPNSVPDQPTPAHNNYIIPPGFPVVGAVKDITLGQEMGDMVGVDNPLVRETLKVFGEAAKRDEYKMLDFSVVYKYLADMMSRM